MRIALALLLTLTLAATPALSQQETTPVQVAQAAEKPAVEEGVVLPQTGGVSTGLIIGIAAVVGLALLSTQSTFCLDSGSDCGGGGPISTTTTGTR